MTQNNNLTNLTNLTNDSTENLNLALVKIEKKLEASFQEGYTPDEMSSFDEAFPNYPKSSNNTLNSSTNLSDSSTSLIDSSTNIANPETLNVFKAISKIHNRIIDSYNQTNQMPTNLTSLINEELAKSNVNQPSSLIVQAINNWKLRPLGSFGEYTLNEITRKALDLNVDFFFNNATITIEPVKLLPLLMTYTTIVKLHQKTYYPNSMLAQFKTSQAKNAYLLRRHNNTMFFMSVIAPLAAIVLVNQCTSVFEGVTVTFNNVNVPDATRFMVDRVVNMGDDSSNTVKYFSFLSILQNPKLRSRIKTCLKIILPTIFIIYYFGFSNILLWMMSIDSLYYKIIGLILILLILFYSISSILLYILFSKNDIDIPTNLPEFLINWLTEIKLLSKSPFYDITIKQLSFEISLLTLSLILLLIQMFK